MTKYCDDLNVPESCPLCGAVIIGPNPGGSFTTFECGYSKHYLLAVHNYFASDYIEQIGIGKYIISDDSGNSYSINLAGTDNFTAVRMGKAPVFKTVEEIENFLIL